MPDGSAIPLTMYQFTSEEIVLSPEMATKLVPAHRADEVKENPHPNPTNAGPLSELQSVAENA
jgi:hypothetical protein